MSTTDTTDAAIADAILARARKHIAEVRRGGRLTKEQNSVLMLLEERTLVQGGRITQLEIAASAPWLGCHPKYEADIVKNEYETSIRRVRHIVRELRMIHHIPVLSDRKGFFLAATPAESASFLRKMESSARAVARTTLATYRRMSTILGGDLLGIKSDYFDSIKP